MFIVYISLFISLSFVINILLSTLYICGFYFPANLLFHAHFLSVWLRSVLALKITVVRVSLTRRWLFGIFTSAMARSSAVYSIFQQSISFVMKFSSIKQVLATTPHETPTIRTLAPHHKNYTSSTNQTRRTLLEKQGQAHKRCTPVDPHTWMCKSGTTSTNLHTAAMWGHGM